MKHKSLIILILFSLLLNTNCGDRAVDNNETEIRTVEEGYLCKGEAYSSDDEYLRAQGVGSSRNEQIARRKAQTDANVNLAAKVSQYRQKIAGHTSSHHNGKNETYTGSSNYSRKVVNERLVNVRVVCIETGFEDDMYNVSMIVEMAVNDIDLLNLAVGFNNYFDKL